MLNILKATGINGVPIYVNANQITLFMPATPAVVLSLTGSIEGFVDGATLLQVAGNTWQIKETPRDIIGGLIALRDKGLRYAIKAAKMRDKEDWEGDDDDYQEQD